MAEYSANALQNVLSNQPVIFTESPVPCNRGLVFHRDESGVFRLASPRLMGASYGCSCGCGCSSMPEALYMVEYHGNIAIPEGGTVGPISMAIAIDGEIDPSSTMIVTPAAVNEFFNVSAGILVAVPYICGCESISVRNTSTQAISVQNSNILINFQGIRR